MKSLVYFRQAMNILYKYRQVKKMKKIMMVLSCILILSVSILNYSCQETIIKVKKIESRETATALKTNTKPEETKQAQKTEKSNQKKYVNIVIMSNGYQTIHHSNLEIKCKNISIYYGKNFRNKANSKHISISKDSKYFKNSNVLKISSKSRMSLVGHNVEHGSPTYSGIFYVYKTSVGLVLVNHVELEEYIARVISSEIGEEAPIEALKAQAVCARTYILKSKAKEYKKYNAVADDSTDFQVYNRIDAGDKCYKAAEETAGIVMTYKGNLINAYYFSTSCGYTTDYRIWGKDKKPYLKGQNITKTKEENLKDNNIFKKYIMSCPKAYESNYPFYRWETKLTSEQIVNGIYALTGSDIGKVKSIEINSRGAGGIAAQITVYGSKKQIIIKKQSDIRKALCSSYAKIELNNGEKRSGMDMLPSAFIHIEKKGSSFKIYGGGFGHGSGMSQNAAIELAKEKQTFDKILKKFYDEVELTEQ